MEPNQIEQSNNEQPLFNKLSTFRLRKGKCKVCSHPKNVEVTEKYLEQEISLRTAGTELDVHYLTFNKHIHQCLPEGEIVYKNGIPTPIENINKGDVVFSKGGKVRVKNTIKRWYNGEIINIRFRGIILRVTPEHPILAVRQNKFEIQRRINNARRSNIKLGFGKAKPNFYYEPEWIPAKSLTNGSYVVLPILEGNRIPYINFNEYIREKFIEKYKTKYQSTYLNCDLSWVFGLYLAEGYSGDTSVVFTLAENEMEYANRVLSKFKTLGFNGIIKREETCHAIRVVIYSKVLSRFFKSNFGTNSHTKYIPSWILDSNKELLQAFLSGYIAGDGCQIINNGNLRTQVGTVSKNIVYGLIIALSRFNKLSLIHI